MAKVLKSIALVAAVLLAAGCGVGSGPQAAADHPAAVHNAVLETDLASITLTPEAESRLGIEIAEVESRRVPRTRTLGGVVEAIPGGVVTLSAPMPGTVLPPDGGLIPGAGATVRGGQPLCRLLPSLPEKDLLGASEEVALRQVQLELAQAAASRARQMLSDRAGSVRQLEEAEAELSRAELNLRLAEAQLELLEGDSSGSAASVLTSLTITSPVEGVVRQVHTRSGQMVTAAAPLLEIVDMDPVWVRVPVYAGDLASIDTARSAGVRGLADQTGTDTRVAMAVTAPPTADPSSVTADLYFELPNRDTTFRPGERVSVTLMLLQEENRLVVPYASLLYDMYGGAWVYASPEPHLYVRSRVELDHVAGELAILSRGPLVGTRVVSAGAAELFGTEFGAGK